MLLAVVRKNKYYFQINRWRKKSRFHSTPTICEWWRHFGRIFFTSSWIHVHTRGHESKQCIVYIDTNHIIFTYACDGFMALMACFGVFFRKAIAAYGVSFAFIEGNSCDWFLTNQADEMFWMPWFAQCCQSLFRNKKRKI